MPCTPAMVQVAATGKVEATATEKVDVGESTDGAVEAPTKTVVARPRLPVVMAPAPKPPKVRSAPVRGCYRYGKEGHIRANCTEMLCSRCSGRRHTADACPMSEEEAVLAMTGEVGARVDVDEDDTVQALAFESRIDKTACTYRRRCRLREGRDERFVSRGRSGRLLGPG